MKEHRKFFEELAHSQQQNNDVIVEIKDGVLNIILNRPKKLNGITIGMYRKITNVINDAQNNQKIKIILLKGNGKNFCSGNDLSNFLLFPEHLMSDYENKKKMSTIMAYELLMPFVDAFINSKKLIIAQVQGVVLGIGFTILGLCDFVYCTKNTVFTAPLVKLAQGPEGCSSYTFGHYFGTRKANELIFLAKDLNAQNALKDNFVNQIFDNYEQMTEEVNKTILQLNNYDQISVLEAKKLINQINKQALLDINKDECTNLIERWSNDQLFEVIAKFFMEKKPKL